MSAVFPKKHELEGVIAEITKAVLKRKDTDKAIPIYLGAIPIAISAALAIVAAALVVSMISDISDMASPEEFDPEQVYADYRTYILHGD